MISKYFLGGKPVYDHLVRPKTGLSGEIWALLRRIEVAFLAAQGDILTAAETTKVWAYQTSVVGSEYVGGFYDFGATDNDFAPSITFGDPNKSVAAHIFVVTGAVPVDDVTIRVTGASITDAGVRTPGDSEDIVIPAGTPVDSYFEFKKFNGQVTIETVSGTPITCNYGWSKYHDFNNQDFDIVGIEAIWFSDSNDAASDIAVIHHKATGWTFNSAAPPTPPAPILQRSTDHGADNEQWDGHQGAWKRAGLSVLVNGADSEGVILEVTSGNAGLGALSFRMLTLELSTRIRIPGT